MLITLLYCECNHFRKRYFPVKCFRFSFSNRIVFFLNTRNTSKVSVRPSETDVPGGLSGLAKHCVQTVHKIKKSEPFASLRTASVCFLFQVLEVWYIILKYNKWVWYIIAFSGEQNLFCNALQTSVFSSVVRNESEPFVYSFSLFFAFRRWKYDISHLSTIYEYDIS